VLWKGCKNWVD